MRERVPLLALVLNDHAYGAGYHHLARRGAATEISTFDSRSIAEIAAAIGADTTRITSPAELAALDPRRFADLDRPHVVERASRVGWWRRRATSAPSPGSQLSRE